MTKYSLHYLATCDATVDKGAAVMQQKRLTGSTASPMAQKLSAILLPGSGNSSDLYKVRQCKLRLLPRTRVLYIHTFTAFCDTLFDINDKAGEAPATRTKNNSDNVDERQNRIAEPFMFLHLIFMNAEK